MQLGGRSYLVRLRRPAFEVLNALELGVQIVVRGPGLFNAFS